jgi:hypothetical protein
MAGDHRRSILERRVSQRRRMVLPVKAYIDKYTHLVHTLDIAPAGARLGALREQLQPGTIVTIQRGPNKSKFRIVWVRQLTPTEVQAGVEALERQDKFWGVDLWASESETKKDVQAFLKLLPDSVKS